MTVGSRCSFISATDLTLAHPQNPDTKTTVTITLNPPVQCFGNTTCLYDYNMPPQRWQHTPSFPSLPISNQSRLELIWCYQHMYGINGRTSHNSTFLFTIQQRKLSIYRTILFDNELIKGTRVPTAPTKTP